MSLDNREYMHRPPESGEGDPRQALWAIMIINAVLFVTAGPGTRAFSRLALSFNGTSWDFMTLVQLVTAGFLHGSFFHLFFNMWGLYLFGSLVLPHIGKTRFLWLYMVGILSGNLLFLLFNLHGYSILVGASGAVCAVMIAAAMLEPDQRFMLLFPPVPMKAKTLVVCYTVLEVLLMFSHAQPHVAHLAHLGGFAGGYLFLKLSHGITFRWDPFQRKTASAPHYHTEYRWTTPPHETGDGPVSSRELDALLDKISREGINSLSEYEIGRLRRARREMRGE